MVRVEELELSDVLYHQHQEWAIKLLSSPRTIRPSVVAEGTISARVSMCPAEDCIVKFTLEQLRHIVNYPGVYLLERDYL